MFPPIRDLLAAKGNEVQEGAQQVEEKLRWLRACVQLPTLLDRAQYDLRAGQ